MFIFRRAAITYRTRRYGVLLTLAAAILFASGCQKPEENTVVHVEEAIPVDTCRLGTQSIQDSLTLSGEIIPRMEIEIQPKIEGTVQRVHVNEGDWVSAGDLLFDFEDNEIRARLQQAQSELANRQAVLSRLLAGERAEDILAAEARVQRASALYENKKVQLSRLESIRSERSDQEIADQQAEVDLALAELKVARAELERNKAGARTEDIEAARADVRYAHAALDLAHEYVNSAHLRSTTDGLLVERNMEPGERVAPGTVVLRLLKPAPLWVRVRVPETDIGQIREDLPCTIRVAAFEQEFSGRIDVIGGDLDPVSRSMEIKILVPNESRLLKPGMFATVTIHTGLRDGVLLVDRDWLHFRQGRAYVYAVEDGLARERRVQTGESYVRFVEITEGLKPGDNIITSDYADLEDGDAIQILTALENMDEIMAQAEVPVAVH